MAMAKLSTSNSDRAKSAGAAVLLQGLLGYALITGLGVEMPQRIADSLKLFSVAPEAEPPPPLQPPPTAEREERPEGAASPPNLRARATQVVAPPPVIPLVIPPPIVAAEKAHEGSDPDTGSADIAGPGTGSGGIGEGTGSGGAGDGDGGGGGRHTPPRWLRGEMRDSDYPRAAVEAGIGGRVGVRYVVQTNGRVTDCVVTESSGSAELDDATCSMIERRFRFEPSRDGRGRPVPAYVAENHEWVMEHLPPEPRRRR